MARPLTYSDNFLKKARLYVKECEDQERRLLKQANEEKGYEMYDNKLQVKLPTIEGLALHLGISRETVYDWEQKYDEFSDIIEQLRAKQAVALINRGLSGDYNSTIAKVLLTKHGYRDESDVHIKKKLIVDDDE